MSFTEKQNELIAKSFCAGILIVCSGFVLSMCLNWPKEFRHGVFNKLAEIAVIQQENNQKIDENEYKFNRLIKQLEKTGFKYAE